MNENVINFPAPEKHIDPARAGFGSTAEGMDLYGYLTGEPPAETREEFLKSRKSGIGGSDVASIFSIGYGCRLRLWRDKRNQPVDYPKRETGPMKLGNWLEPHIAEEYAKETGRQVIVRGLAVHPEHPELIVHIDRDLIDPARPDLGVLEIKACGREMFYQIRRQGLPEDYILQLQHGMLVTNRTWGAYAVMNRDNAELMHWDVERDEAVCNLILEEGPIFWATVENGPAPEMLDPDDKRCHGCEYSLSCQGAALLPLDTSGEMPQAGDLYELIEEYRRLDAMYCHKLADNSRGTETDLWMEAVKSEIKSRLGERQAVLVGGDKVYFRPQDGRETLDTGIVGTYTKVRDALRARAEDLEAFDRAFPPASVFQKRGNPFKVLRIYPEKK